VQNLSILATDADGSGVTSSPFSVSVTPMTLTAATTRPSRLGFPNAHLQISGASVGDMYDRNDNQTLAGYKAGSAADMTTLIFNTPVKADRCHFSVYVPSTTGTRLTVYMYDETGRVYFNMEGYQLKSGWNIYDGECGFQSSGPKLVSQIMLSRENYSETSIFTGEFRIGYQGVDAP
jgi:hypothetical protein